MRLRGRVQARNYVLVAESSARSSCHGSASANFDIKHNWGMWRVIHYVQWLEPWFKELLEALTGRTWSMDPRSTPLRC